MSSVPTSRLKKWSPSTTDYSHFKRFEPLYGATVPQFPLTLGRQKRVILDQGNSDECTAFQGATRAGYRFGQDFSHKWQGAKEGEIAGVSIINGADPRTALAVPNTFGALPLSVEPSTVAQLTPQQYLDWHSWPLALDKSAALSMEVAYNLVDGPYDHFDNIRTVLQQGLSENEVVLVFSSWFDEWNHTNGIMPIPKSTSQVNHAHLFIDWELINGEPMLVDHLSQGTGFGADGFGFFDRALVNDQVEKGNMGCYIFRQHPQQSAIQQAIQELDNIGIDFAMRILTAFSKGMPSGNVSPSMQDKIRSVLLANLGKHCTLNPQIPADVGCAEAVSYLLKQLGIVDGPEGIAGTAQLLSWVEGRTEHFTEIDSPEPGALIISATGTGNGSVEGHTGFFGGFGTQYAYDWGIVSNDSNTGLLREQWSFSEWNKWYTQQGGITPRIFRVLG